MTATIPHWFWLFWGVLLFGLSISLSFLSWRASRKTIAEVIAPEREEIKRLEAALHDSARSNLEYRGERDQCEDEKRFLQKRFDDMFTPLQIDAIALAIELENFSKEMNARPDLALPRFEDSVQGITARTEFLMRRNGIFESTYRQRFGDRLRHIVDRLGAVGVKRHFLDSRVASDISEAIDAQTAAHHLLGAAFELSGLYLYPPRTFTVADIETMAGNEMNRRLREEPGFAETMERYRMKTLIIKEK